jgi:hypothetical protein
MILCEEKPVKLRCIWIFAGHKLFGCQKPSVVELPYQYDAFDE